MITSLLQGGLGNQMFQIAAAWSHSKTIGSNCEFDLSKSHVETQGKKALKYGNSIFKKLTNTNIDYNKMFGYREPKFSYNPIPKQDNLLLVGNFQSEKYFDDHKNILDEIFYFDDEKINNIKSLIERESLGKKISSIHVRRGDYLKKPNFHPTCDMNYYNKAMDIINADKYFVVSDDLEWCKENFKGDQFFFSPFTDELDDLYLIMGCDNHIIANSSFSWWGAYLSKSKNIICPSTWFGVNGPQDTKDIYIKEWTII